MAGGLARFNAEFTDYLDRSGLDRSLLHRHHLRVYGCLAAAVGVLAYNQLALRPETATATARTLLIWLSVIAINIFTVGLMRSRHLGVDSLVRPTASVAERAGLVARYVDDRGLLFLILAALAVIVLIAATAVGLRLASKTGAIFLVNLIPIGQLFVHGRFEAPTREQLLRLYRVLAVRQVRLDQLAARSKRH